MVALEGDVSLAKNRPAWIEVRSPNFIVVTNANEREASLVANQFEIIRTVFLDYFGDVSVEDQPVTILAARDEDTFKHLLPDAWTQKGSALRAGFFQGGSDKNYVALRVDASLNKDAYEPFEPIYHEYFHFLTRKMMTVGRGGDGRVFREYPHRNLEGILGRTQHLGPGRAARQTSPSAQFAIRY
jgi:hypothetical protein